MSKREIYTIELDRPDNVTVQRLINYMREAIEDWGGQLRPPGCDPEFPEGDPLFYPWAVRGAKNNKGKLPMIRIKRSYPS